MNNQDPTCCLTGCLCVLKVASQVSISYVACTGKVTVVTDTRGLQAVASRCCNNWVRKRVSQARSRGFTTLRSYPLHSSPLGSRRPRRSGHLSTDVLDSRSPHHGISILFLFAKAGVRTSVRGLASHRTDPTGHHCNNWVRKRVYQPRNVDFTTLCSYPLQVRCGPQIQ
jgi:hypothetical protein